MIIKMAASQKELLEEMKAEFWVRIIEIFQEYFWVFIIIIIAAVILFFMLFYHIYVYIKENYKVSEIFTKFFKLIKKSKDGKKRRLLTKLPPAALINEKTVLPSDLENLLSNFDNEGRIHIQLLSDDHRCMEEYAKLLYRKINENKIGDHIGWISYKKYDDKEFNITTCINEEFYYGIDESNLDKRQTQYIDLLNSTETHSILFINILDYPENGDDKLERFTGLSGTSTILITEQEIKGYEVYKYNKKVR